MLQFITNTEAGASPAEQIKGVIAGGCRWVQIRMKEASDEDIEKVVAEIKPLCIETETFLILDDRVELARNLMSAAFTSARTTCCRQKPECCLGLLQSSE